MKSRKNECHIKDLGLASALITFDIKLIRLEKDPKGFFWFVFPAKESNEIVSAYWSDELNVPARKYNLSSKSLKEKLFSQPNSLENY